MAASTQFLQRIGNSWYVRVKVPRAAQSIIGNTHLRKALGTRDLDKANELKWAYVKAFKDQIQRALKGPVPDGVKDPLLREAYQYRDGILQLHRENRTSDLDIAEDFAADRAREIEAQTGDEKRAKDWYDIATAKDPLLSELLDEWLKDQNYKEQTKRQHRAAFANLKEFLKGDRLPSYVTADVATDFVEDWLKKSGQSYNTQRRKLNSLVAFWRWLGAKRHVERGFNPWTGFVLSKARTPKRTPDKRPYTEAELLKLFEKRPAYEGLADVMVLGLYTGARLEEICALKMQDVEHRRGAFFVTLRTGKGTTKVRRIAVVHALPSAVLKRLWKSDGDPSAQLFPSFKPGGYDGKLSWSVSKVYSRWRDSLGLPRDVDFHSFRRTFVTALENLGVDQLAIARYIGHAFPTLAAKVYSGGSTEQTNLKVGASIQYPPEVEAAVERFLKAG